MKNKNEMPLLNHFFCFPQVNLASLEHLNLQLSACGFSLHKDPDKNFIFRVSYSGCFVEQKVCHCSAKWTLCFHKPWHLRLGFFLVVIILWLYVDCSAWLPYPDTESGENDESNQRQTSQSCNEMSCRFCAAQQRANPMWPRVYPGNY